MEVVEDKRKILAYPKYKESGEYWLGRIPNHWELARLGMFFAERKTKVSDKEYPPLSVTKFGVVPQLDDAAKTNDGDNRKLVKKGDFVINSRSDRKGSSGLSNLDGSVSLINIVLDPQGIDGIYCNYLLKSNAFVEEFYRNGHGIVADLWTTRYDEMKAIKIAVPPPVEQTAIARFLDRKTGQIDKAIAQKEKLIELLKERRQMVIDNMLEIPNYVELTNKRFTPWVFKLSEGWSRKPLKSICVMKGRLGWQNLRSDEYTETGPLLVSSEHFNDEKVEWHRCNRVAPERFLMAPEIILKQEDILFMKDGASMGKLAYVNELPEEACLNSHLLLMRPDSRYLQPKYLFYSLKATAFNAYMCQERKGSTFFGFSQEAMGNFPMTFPSPDKQTDIVAKIDKALQRIDFAQQAILTSIAKLKDLKSTLINSAVTGKIKVPGLETMD
jgi:type I restriction enzyme S subunit